MKLNYKIIWVEDKIETKPFQNLVENIKQFVSDRFFTIDIQTAEDFEEFKVKFNVNGSFDLVITDYSLNDSHGSQVIDFIRMDKNIFTEVFFYSANSELKSVDLANRNRISFYQLEGTGYHNELQRKIEELIALTIAKFEHAVAMRGMIMNETSSLDVSIIDILNKIIENGDSDGIVKTIKEKYLKSNTEFVEELEKAIDVEKILYIIGADHRVRAVIRNVEKGDIKTILNDYTNEIITIRNKFAHAVLLKDSNGKEYFKHGKSGLEFNEDLCKTIRKNINKHRTNLDNLEKGLNA